MREFDLLVIGNGYDIALEYWPRLRNPEDIIEYISVYNKVDEFYTLNNLVENYSVNTKNEIDTFYSELKEELNKKYNSLK